MTLKIDHPDAEHLARALAKRTGESLTDAVLTALRERLERETIRRDRGSIREDLRRIQQRFIRGRSDGSRTADEIIGYDDAGISV